MVSTLPELHLGSTLEELPHHRAVVAPDTLGAEVERRLREQEQLPGVMVSHAEGLAGIISRRRFLEKMTRRYSPDIYLTRPVNLLLEELPAPLLRLAAATPIAHAADLALERPWACAYEPVLVDFPGGDTRMVDMDDLLRAQSRILAVANEEKARLLQEKSAALEELKRAQTRLVEAQKMAALAQVVAGVAHEINTPIGVSLTAVTHLQEETRRLVQRFTEGGLKRSELKRFLAVADESAALILSDLERAAGLVKSFKQVAVDQSSEQRRRFDLKEYLRMIRHSLLPKLRQGGHKMRVACPKEIELDSYPGPLWQVLTNLTVNSLAHAFATGEQGAITIRARTADARVRITFEDDGCGIPADHLGRIFEPFFTTLGGQGGSGLGLHIVYNLVTHTLGGEIRCESPAAAGHGARFVIELPCTAP